MDAHLAARPLCNRGLLPGLYAKALAVFVESMPVRHAEAEGVVQGHKSLSTNVRFRTGYHCLDRDR